MDSSVNSLVIVLKNDYPEFTFKLSKKFSFKPPRTIFYNDKDADIEPLILHEVSHAILGHSDFKVDIERLKMENEAWEKAKELAVKYNVQMDEDLIQEKLDSYRDWLFNKSKCKKCGLTRYQTPDGKYHCPNCNKK